MPPDRRAQALGALAVAAVVGALVATTVLGVGPLVGVYGGVAAILPALMIYLVMRAVEDSEADEPAQS
jgi:hypothetical protein